jgi:hypothetical protein
LIRAIAGDEGCPRFSSADERRNAGGAYAGLPAAAVTLNKKGFEYAKTLIVEGAHHKGGSREPATLVRDFGKAGLGQI